MLKFEALICNRDDSAGTALSVTFEQAFEALERLDRLFIEPDGSFVWRGSVAGGGEWQVDGNLIDRGECLAHVELKGCCPMGQFDMLLAAFGWPGATLIFQLPRRGEYLDDQAFRQLAANEAGAF